MTYTPNNKYPCLNEECSSSDGMHIYPDMHGYCFSCSTLFSQYTLTGTHSTVPQDVRETHNLSTQAVELLALGLCNDDLGTYWTDKKKITEAEEEILKAHGSFGMIDPYSVENAYHILLADGGDTGGIKPYHLDMVHKRYEAGMSAIIIRDIRGKPTTIQWLDASPKKLFLSGAKKKGGMVVFEGEEEGSIFVSEGVATAFAVFQMLKCKHTVVAALDTGNMADVLPLVYTHYHADNQIILAGDNDCLDKITGEEKPADASNPGLEVSTKYSGFLDNSVYPDPKWGMGADWDDVFRSQTYKTKGDMAVLLLSEVLETSFNYGPFNGSGKKVSINAGRIRLDNMVSSTIANYIHEIETLSGDGSVNKVSVLDVVPGAGKTEYVIRSILRHIADGCKLPFYIFGHTHEHCEELRLKFLSVADEMQLSLVGLMGKVEPQTKETCLDPYLRRQLKVYEAEGKTIENNKLAREFCNGCPLSRTCKFMKARKETAKKQIQIMPHALMKYNRTEETKAGITFIDEDPLLSLNQDPLRINLSKRLPQSLSAEERKVFKDAMEELSEMADGEIDVKMSKHKDVVSMFPSYVDGEPVFDRRETQSAANRASMLASEILAEWEKAVKETRKDYKESSRGYMNALRRRKLLRPPMGNIKAWVNLSTTGHDCWKTNGEILVQDQPRFNYRSEDNRIIVADAVALRPAYEQVFKGYEIDFKEPIDIKFADNAKMLQIPTRNYAAPSEKLLAQGINNHETILRELTNLMLKHNENSKSKSAIIAVNAMLSHMDELDGMNFIRALGTNGYEDFDLLIVLSWSRIGNHDLLLQAFNLWGNKVMDNLWVSSSELLFDKDKKRKFYPTNPDVQALYLQKTKKPVYHAIHRLRPIVPGRHDRKTLLISSQFIDEGFEETTEVAEGIFSRKTNDLSHDGYHSASAWVYLIADAILKSEDGVEFNLRTIAEVIGATYGNLRNTFKKEELEQELVQFGITKTNVGTPSRPKWKLRATE